MITLRFAALKDAADFVEIYSPAVLSTAISFEEALPSTDEMRERIANVTRRYPCITLPNEGSVGIHEAYGFKHLGTYGQVGFKYGAWHDVGWWELNLNDSVGTPQEPLSIDDLEVDFS